VTATAIQRKGYDNGFNVKDKAVANPKPQTLDALFANMKEQRMRLMSQKVNHENAVRLHKRRNVAWQQQGSGGARGGPRRQFANYAK
ncbi:hypothetical protein BHM03_00018827, partial [Ensete ventricosum]